MPGDMGALLVRQILLIFSLVHVPLSNVCCFPEPQSFIVMSTWSGQLCDNDTSQKGNKYFHIAFIS